MPEGLCATGNCVFPSKQALHNENGTPDGTELRCGPASFPNSYPDMVENLLGTCGSASCSPHNYVRSPTSSPFCMVVKRL